MHICDIFTHFSELSAERQESKSTICVRLGNPLLGSGFLFFFVLQSYAERGQKWKTMGC
jgi:hypothetical protein